jgi:hypothetical protein
VNKLTSEQFYDFYHEKVEHYKQLVAIPYEGNEHRFVLCGGIPDPITKERANFHYRFWKDTIISVIEERDHLKEENSNLRKQLKELKEQAKK